MNMGLSKLLSCFKRGEAHRIKRNVSPFRTSKDIDNPLLLFGRDDDLKILCAFAEGLHQIEIIGARRYGKTCLIKCFITKQKNNENRKTYPVYLDLYSDGIKGTSNVYRYLSAQVLCNLYVDGYINGNIIVDEYTVRLNEHWEKIYKQLLLVSNDDIMVCFDKIAEKYSRDIGQTILLLIDEYEKAIDSFDDINGLMHLRSLSDGPTDIMFWIIGATPSEKLILEADKAVIRGSGVFNGIAPTIFVRPLNFTDFKQMWFYECSLISDEAKREELDSLLDKVYESSGGVPCFAKEIGAIVNIENNYPLYNRLNIHFAEIVKNLNDNEMRCLRDLQLSPKDISSSKKTKSIVTLEEYGIICLDKNNRYKIASRFFADYIRAGILEENCVRNDEPVIDRIVQDIKRVYYNINDRYYNLYGKCMFDPTKDTVNLFDDLPKRCDSREKVPNFVNTIYLLYWEGAKESKGGDKIPDPYKWTMFRKAMDRIRHIIGKAHQQDKLEILPGQIDKATALKEIWGDSIEPQTSEEWLYFQECMLHRFLQELTELYNSIDNGSQEVPITLPIPKLVTGIFHKGLYGNKDTVEQYNGYTQKVRSIRIGEILSDGDEVEYSLCREPNHDPTKGWFYYAEDVHLLK